MNNSMNMKQYFVVRFFLSLVLLRVKDILINYNNLKNGWEKIRISVSLTKSISYSKKTKKMKDLAPTCVFNNQEQT